MSDLDRFKSYMDRSEAAQKQAQAHVDELPIGLKRPMSAILLAVALLFGAVLILSGAVVAGRRL